MLELDVFLDMPEALLCVIGCGFLIIYLLRCYKDQLFNSSGLGKNGNIRLMAAIFLPASFPSKSLTNVSMADYSADFDELICYSL